MSITPESITAALKKLGPCSPGDLARHLGASKQTLKTHIKAMLDAGTIKAAGVTKSRRLGLPDQKLDGPSAPPQQHRKPSKAKGKRRKSAAGARPRPKPAAADPFTPAFTADLRLVIVNGGTPPVFFTPQQTKSIAELLFNHFEA